MSSLEFPTAALRPGGVIGILGGGQLARMLTIAAGRLGYHTHVFEPEEDCPAAPLTSARTTAGWDDMAALDAFAEAIDVATYEFENVPTAALDRIERRCAVLPGRHALAVSQDRVDEKQFLNDLGLPTASWAAVDDVPGLTTALAAIGAPAILKTRRMGYDGKGQVRLKDDAPAAAEAALAELGGAPCILEGMVDFDSEISVIVARAGDGSVSAYDPGTNEHRGGILRLTTVPCGQPERVVTDAVLMAAKIVTSLEYVGVMGVEMFVTKGGLMVNEIAPRVHNSGHWTQAGAAVCQFEQHVRAIAGLPLGDGQRHADVVMENLIGDDIERIPTLLAERDTQIHLYGKSEVRPGRKMGHVNRVTRRRD
ncbi:5-(carboxyamino)imidazole ribonucleotide synthase [Paracoccus suum]|uniref:N5-carboxyaminoimidazole ribonucleotide synthase n=1 Tax=Paracoccus suum TaxID=2259340 RepID=A0A344PKC2_9RHOB|nr:5-(carboxyamino)imidazole ribonucleotide synthase [Paracoccus suum]AXC49827.1 5-(carboxyamino)imidazole ribonucleotide synthase [Paracoccus suum]